MNELIKVLVILFSGCVFTHILIWGLRNFVGSKDIDIQQVEVINFKR